MTDTNSVTVVGRLVKDAELKPGETPVGFFSIASNRDKKDQGGGRVEEPSYFDVNVYGRYAETVTPMLKKGSLVCVTGSMKQERWADKDTGRNKSRVVVTADAVQIFRKGK